MTDALREWVVVAVGQTWELQEEIVRLRSSGMQSALADVSTATQQASALSRDSGAVLDAVAEVRAL